MTIFVYVYKVLHWIRGSRYVVQIVCTSSKITCEELKFGETGTTAVRAHSLSSPHGRSSLYSQQSCVAGNVLCKITEVMTR